jgi:hypothetical protein
VSKLIPVKDIGIPVPSTAPPTTDSIACYYGPSGFKPDYGQSARVALPLSSLSVTTVNALQYYDFPASTVLPANLPTGAMDFYFTLVDANGSESDFSPVTTETVDTTPPPPLGQPIVLS